MNRPCIVLVVITFLSLAAPGWSATTLQLAVGSVTTAMNTELNALASNAFVTSTATMDNRIGQALGGYLICRVEWAATYGSAPTTGALTGWFLKTVDGSTFETATSGSVTQNRLPDFVIPVVTGQTATKASVDTRCPAERFKVLLQNTGTGVSTNAGGVNTLKILPITLQGN